MSSSAPCNSVHTNTGFSLMHPSIAIIFQVSLDSHGNRNLLSAYIEDLKDSYIVLLVPNTLGNQKYVYASTMLLQFDLVLAIRTLFL